jgi:hypothetical protein
MAKRRTCLGLIALLGGAVVVAANATASEPATSPAAEEGVAVAIVYDTSGSMSDTVRDAGGRMSPKYRIAGRALGAIVDRLEAVATNTSAGGPRSLEVGIFIFEGQRAREAVKFGPFDPAALRDWMRSFSRPGGPTPLGEAVRMAGEAVLGSRLSRRHVLVLTDGVNTAGREPAETIPRIQAEARRRGTAVSFHFVAFDVNASEFARVKKLGATVVGAADEAQLRSQLEFILEEKILLEAEEPAGGGKSKK